MGDPQIMVGYRYIVGSREFAVLRLDDGERRLARIAGWADHIGRPSNPAAAHYVVLEFGTDEATHQTALVEIPAGFRRMRSRPPLLSRRR